MARRRFFFLDHVPAQMGMKAEADEIHQTELSIRGMLALMIKVMSQVKDLGPYPFNSPSDCHRMWTDVLRL